MGLSQPWHIPLTVRGQLRGFTPILAVTEHPAQAEHQKGTPLLNWQSGEHPSFWPRQTTQSRQGLRSHMLPCPCSIRSSLSGGGSTSPGPWVSQGFCMGSPQVHGLPCRSRWPSACPALPLDASYSHLMSSCLPCRGMSGLCCSRVNAR